MYAPTVKREFTVSERQSAIIFELCFVRVIPSKLFCWCACSLSLPLKRLKRIPRITLDKICETYKIIPYEKLLNIIVPTVPMTKIGPDVVQKMDIFFASTSEIKPFSYKSEIIFAPMG